MHAHACVHVCICSTGVQVPNEANIRSPGARVTEGCKPSDMGTES